MEQVFNNSLFLDAVVLQASVGSIVWKALVVALAIFLAARFLSGVHIEGGTVNLLIVAVVIAALDATIGWLLDGITRPLSFITLGLFRFIIDAVIVLLADYLLKIFKVDNFIWALLMALVISIISSLLGVV